MSSILRSLWGPVLLLTFLMLLVACGGGAGNSSNTSPSETASPRTGGSVEEPQPEPDPGIVIKESLILGVREAIELAFDEALAPESLKLNGFLLSLAAPAEWSEGYRKVTLRPIEGAWESGRHQVSGTLQTAAGDPVRLEVDVDIRLQFETFQEASFVIGQGDFESSIWHQEPSSSSLFDPYGMPTVMGGRLWIPDLGNNRLLGFDGVPVQNQADASWVAGQPDFSSYGHGTSAAEFWTPMMALEQDGYFYMLENGNHRVTIFDHSPPAEATNVIGQADLETKLTSCTESGLHSPSAMFIVDGKLLIADSGNNRVLIWNRIPKDVSAQAADLVLGQNAMDSCARNDDDQNGAGDRQPSARTLHEPVGIWSDGQRLVVSDAENNRVLIWNSFPRENFAPADIVLGQADFASSRSLYPPTAESLSYPHAVWSNGLQLFVADPENNRVLIWDEFPVENYQPADTVLGQPDFETAELRNDPTAATFSMPGGLVVHRDKLIVLDSFFDRVLIFEAGAAED